MTPPELRTARLLLRPLAATDVPELTDVYTDPAVSRFFRAKVTDRAGVAALVRRRLDRPVGPGMGSWVFDLDGRVVGLGHLWPSAQLPGGVPEFGWLLDRGHWGRGLATEAAGAILDHGLRGLGLSSVWALVHRDNAASLALARRLGLLEVGGDEHHGAPHRVFVGLPDHVGG